MLEKEQVLSPKAASVLRQMQDGLREPLHVRKQTFRELLLEYHPDKNQSFDSKEVFQVVNASRVWFLVE